IHEHDRQNLLPGALQQAEQRGIRRESVWLLSEVEPVDSSTVSARPLHVGGDGDERLIDVCPADTRAAAESGIEDLDVRHWFTCPSQRLQESLQPVQRRWDDAVAGNR